MAEIPIGSEKNVNSTTNATPLTSENGLVFNRRDFLKIGGTNQEISKTGIESADFSNESVVLGEDTKAAYTNFMTNHFENLLRLKQQGKVGVDAAGNDITFDAMFASGGSHGHESKILSLITTEDGKTIDQQKLYSFLKTPRGMMISTQLLEDVTAQKLFALGLSASINPKGERPQGRPELKIRLGMDQGKLKSIAENIGISTDELLASTGVGMLAWAGSQIANDYFLGEPVAGLPAPLVGAVGGALGGFLLGGIRRIGQSLNNEGVTLNLQRSVEGISILQSSPQDAAYMKALTGIDVNDFTINGDQIEFKKPKDRFAESIGDMDDVRAEILQGIYARNNFLEDLGIDPSKQDATAEQRFLKGQSGSTQTEKLGTHWQEMIEAEFKPNQGGIKDINGNIPGTPNFDPKNLDVKGNLKRYSEARRRVIEKMTEEFIVGKKDQEIKKAEAAQEKRFSQKIGEAVNIIDTKIENLKKDDTKLKRESSLNEEKTKLETRATEIDEQLKAFEGSNESRKKQEEIAIEILNREAKTISNLSDIDGLITDINNELNVGSGGGLSLRRKLADVEDKINANYQALVTDLVTRISGLPPKEQKIDATIFTEFRKSAIKRFADEYDPIAQQIKDAEERRTQLLTLRKQYQEADISIAKSDQEQASKAQVDPVDMNKTVTDIQSASVNPVTEGDIRTLSFDQLIQKALQIEEPAGTKLYTDKESALKAMLDARAELRAKDEEGTGTFTNPQMRVRRSRLLLQTEKQYITERQAEIDAQKSKIGIDIQQEIARLEGFKAALPNIKDVSDRQGELFSEAREELTQRVEQYVSKDPIDAADDKYTPAEKSTLYPKGYYEMLDLIFKYKESPNREQVFTHLNKIMPPKKLALMLQNYLIKPSGGVGPGPAKKDDLSQIFKYIQTNKNGFTSADYRRAMGSIITDLRDEALAFTKI